MTNNKKQILFFSTDTNKSGGALHVLYLCVGLHLRGYSIKVVLPCGWLKSELENYKFTTISLNYKLSDIFRLREIIARHPEYILHFQSVKAGGIGRLSSIGFTNTVIYTEHLWTNDYHMHSKLRERIHLSTIKLLSRKTDKIICVSNAVKQFYLTHDLAASSKLIVIYNGVELKSREKLVDARYVTIGTMGSLDKNKGIDLIIKALRLSDKKLHLLIVGMGDQKIELKKMIKSYSLTDRVEIAQDDVEANFWNRIDIYVQSSYSESFGMALTEALILGIPSIASDVGATHEIFNNRKYLFKRGDYNDLQKKLSILLSGFTNQKKYFIEKKSIFKKNFSIENMISNYDEFYSTL